MNSTTTTTGRFLGLGLALLLAGGAAAAAGELALSWGPSHDDVTAGYEVEVLGPGGLVEQTVDSGRDNRVRIGGLPDGETRRFRVRPYDRWGHKAAEPSAEIVSLPAARIAALDDWQSDGATGRGVLVGTNFSERARVVSVRAGVVVLATTPAGPGRLAFTARLAAGGGTPVATDLAVVNPVRRSAEFLAACPQLLDVDASGTVDAADLAAVTQAFGAQLGSAQYRLELDVDGDGVIDGEDAAPLRAFLERDPSPAAGGSGKPRDLTDRETDNEVKRRARKPR